MKRIVSLILSIVLMLGLVACGAPAAGSDPAVTTVDTAMAEKEAAANEVVRLINAIGNVTVNSGSAIEAARTAFNALDGATQGLVTNLDVLVSAEGTYTTAKAAEIDALIDAIGTVTLDSASAIDAAAAAFSSANADIQLAVAGKNTLETARKELAKLKAAEVEALIKAIGKVSTKSEAKINAADAALKALTSEEAALVTNTKTLEDAKTKYEELKRDAVLKSLKKKTDKVQGITWYQPSAEPKYADTRSYVLPYIGVQNNYAWLRLRYHYTGDDWIFFTKITIVVDGTKYYKVFSYYDVERDNEYGNVWEWVDVQPSDADIEMLKAIANSKETIVRFEGDVYHKDLTVKAKDKQAIKDVLAAYEYLK